MIKKKHFVRLSLSVKDFLREIFKLKMNVA